MLGGRLSVFMALIICLTPSMADYLTNSRLAVRGIALHPSLVFRGGADADSTLVEPSIVDKSDGTLPTTVLPDNGAMKSTQPSCWSALHKLWRVVVSLLSPSYSYAKVGTDILGDSSQMCGFAQDDESWRTQRKKLNDAELQPNSRKRVLKDLRIMKRDGSEIGIEVEDCECLTDWVVKVIGAAGTIYEGEIYRLRVRFHPDYPSQPPEVTFMRPAPVHEHIYSDGKVRHAVLSSSLA